MFDISILPIAIEEGRERNDLPGLLVTSAPRKAQRLRAQDTLILFMSLYSVGGSSGPSFTSAQHKEMLARLAETYFTTPGSVTAGLRAVVTRLNDFLLNRNLRSASEGQITGSINIAVLHASTLLVAHAGATHSLVFAKTQSQHFDDSQAGRGLGLSKQITPRFYQSGLEPGDILILSADLPAAWTPKNLSGILQLSFDHLRRRLMSQSGDLLRAAVFKFQAGKGQIVWHRGPAGGRVSESPDGKKPTVMPKPPVVDHPSPAPTNLPVSIPPSDPGFSLPPDPIGEVEVAQVEPQEPANVDEFEVLEAVKPVDVDEGSPSDEVVVSDDEAPPGLENAGSLESQEPRFPVPGPETHADDGNNRVPAEAAGIYLGGVSEAAVEGKPAVHARSAAAPSRSAGKAQPAPQTAVRGVKPAQQRRRRSTQPSPVAAWIGQGFLHMRQALSSGQAKAARVTAPLMARAFPARSEPIVSLSPTTMLFVALCVPLIVVAIATTVYFNAGRTEQFHSYLNNAEQYVQRATEQTDPQLQRDSWTQALLWLELADNYGQTDQSAGLRQQAQSGLDLMEGIVRIPYQEAVAGGFSPDVKITHMEATLNDVYLLDSSQGRILRLYRVGNDYEVDTTFVCGPGQAGGLIIGPLIDMVALPPNNAYRATVMGIDTAGNLVYCAPTQTGFDSLPLPPPDTNWGAIKGITLLGNTLYVLDPSVNAVWYLVGVNSVFSQPPRLFFDNQVPQMGDVVDLAMDQEFLYLLHADGRMTTCEASGFELSPTRCNDPFPYGDSRTGREPAPLNFPDARFTTMQATQPPDPSLFILDSGNASLYHFSLRRLNLQRQYRAEYNADFPLPSTSPSAFVITPNRRALLAFDNLIYFAPMP